MTKLAKDEQDLIVATRTSIAAHAAYVEAEIKVLNLMSEITEGRGEDVPPKEVGDIMLEQMTKLREGQDRLADLSKKGLALATGTSPDSLEDLLASMSEGGISSMIEEVDAMREADSSIDISGYEYPLVLAFDNKTDANKYYILATSPTECVTIEHWYQTRGSKWDDWAASRWFPTTDEVDMSGVLIN